MLRDGLWLDADECDAALLESQLDIIGIMHSDIRNSMRLGTKVQDKNGKIITDGLSLIARDPDKPLMYNKLNIIYYNLLNQYGLFEPICCEAIVDLDPRKDYWHVEPVSGIDRIPPESVNEVAYALTQFLVAIRRNCTNQKLELLIRTSKSVSSIKEAYQKLVNR